MTFSNFTTLNNGLNTLINNVNNSASTLGLLRNEELKMFPTPPSLEQHTNSSPGGLCGSISDNIMESIDTLTTHKNDLYSNFGSPQEEPIEVLRDFFYYFTFCN